MFSLLSTCICPEPRAEDEREGETCTEPTHSSVPLHCQKSHRNLAVIAAGLFKQFLGAREIAQRGDIPGNVLSAVILSNRDQGGASSTTGCNPKTKGDRRIKEKKQLSEDRGS